MQKTLLASIVLLTLLSPFFKTNGTKETKELEASINVDVKELYNSFSPENEQEEVVNAVEETVEEVTKEQSSEEKQIVQPDTYIEMISIPNCGGCSVWKRESYPKLVSFSDYWKDIVRFKTITPGTGNYRLYPSFDIYVKGKKVKTLEGYISPSTLGNSYNNAIANYEKQADSKKQVQTDLVELSYPLRSSNWTYNGHQFYNKEEAINHLLNDGVHRRKFTRQQLEQLSLEELKALHSDDHEGKVNYASIFSSNKPTYRYRSNSSIKYPTTRTRGVYRTRYYSCPTCPKG